METEFIQIISNNARLLHTVCKLYCTDEEDRKDLRQEIVLQLWRAFPTFRREAQLSTWMYRIALNTAITLVRRQVRRPVRAPITDDLLDVLPVPVSEETDERMEQFYGAVEQLSAVEKALVFLYLDDNSYEEIAEVMGISPSNVGVKLSRIRGKLKKIVELTNE